MNYLLLFEHKVLFEDLKNHNFYHLMNFLLLNKIKNYLLKFLLIYMLGNKIFLLLPVIKDKY